MTQLYPLCMQPELRRYLWGGRRLGTALGKPIAEHADYAESWEIVDHDQGQSVVANGTLAGWTLAKILEHHGRELMGQHYPQKRFPLLFKFLDCNRQPSVQVHPDDQQAGLLDPPDLGKTEAWVVLETDPGSTLYAGLKPNVDRTSLAKAIQNGITESCLNTIQAKAGDCLLIPAGVVHALGKGMLVAEIQQSSNTTFRLFDWNRVGTDGQPRILHVQEALTVIDFDIGPIQPQIPQPLSGQPASRLVECNKFVLDRWSSNEPFLLAGDDRFHIITIVKGTVTTEHADLSNTFTVGQTILQPASGGTLRLVPQTPAVILDMFLP